MRFSWIFTLLRGTASSLRTPPALAFGCGLLGGLFLLDWTHQFAATFGTSLTVVVSTALALAMGCELGWNSLRRSGIAPTNRLWSLAIANIIPAVFTTLFPLGIIAARGVAGLIDVQTMAIPIVGLLFVWCLAAVLLGFPVFWVARLAVLLQHSFANAASSGEQRNLYLADSQRLTIRSLGGVAAGLVVGVVFAAPLIGVHSTGLLAALCGGTVGIVAMISSRQAAITTEAVQPADTQQLLAPIAPGANLGPAVIELRPSLAEVFRALVIIACLGAGTALASRAAHQLMPASGYIVYCEWAAVIGGAAIGAGWAGRSGRRTSNGSVTRFGGRAGWACLLVAVWESLCLVAFGKLVDISLASASSISVVALFMLVRCLIAATFVLPHALAWGALAVFWGRNRGNTDPTFAEPPSPQAFGPPWQFVAWTVGLLSMRWALAAGVPAADLIAGLSMALLMLALACFWSTQTVPRGWISRGLAVTAVCLAIAAPWWRSNYDPARSARLLFSTNVFVAYQAGIDRASLSFLDDGRNVAVREGERGTYTAWKYHGAQFHLRESGIPKGMISAHPELCPQFSAEVLPAVLALTLHDDPRRVLLMGLGSSTTLSTCLAFPLVDLTCIEGDAALIDLLDRCVWQEPERDPRNDHRVRMVPLDPALAATCHDDRYDVILCGADPLALWQAEPYYTREFYRSASRRLQADGLFVQRFQQVDYGPRPLQTVVRTMRQEFSNVIAIESAPGDLVLLATNSPSGIVRDDTLKRLQAEQVRKTLSQVGWDWTVSLNISAWPNEALAKLAATGGTNTVANGRFAFTIPQEVMRWGPKGQEIAAVLAPHASRLLEWDNIPDDDPEVLRRLSEVVGQRKLMIDYPDQPWAYRKTIRDELKERPRSLIQQVSDQVFDREMHPDDKRRLEYFTALGEAAKKKVPSPDAIAHVAEFEIPYDPVVSYFLHQEVAALYARSTEGQKEAELAHRLHAINFSDPRDRSVRDVVDALALLAGHPESCPEPSVRWDHMNSLLQVMKMRWEARGAVEPRAPRIVLNDLEKSISAVENSFETMDILCAEAGVDSADWQARRAFLERSLVRPLRTYRSNLLPYHLQKERRDHGQSAESPKSAESPPAGFEFPGL